MTTEFKATPLKNAVRMHTGVSRAVLTQINKIAATTGFTKAQVTNTLLEKALAPTPVVRKLAKAKK